MKLTLTALPKTWLIDIDGTLVKHNGHLNGGDELLPGVSDFFAEIPADDIIVLLTSRKKEHEALTREFLFNNSIRYNHIIFDLPFGERILINDKKPSGLITAHAVNLERDTMLDLGIDIDNNL